jgi:hypothetical protein
MFTLLRILLRRMISELRSDNRANGGVGTISKVVAAGIAAASLLLLIVPAHLVPFDQAIVGRPGRFAALQVA